MRGSEHERRREVAEKKRLEEVSKALASLTSRGFAPEHAKEALELTRPPSAFRAEKSDHLRRDR